MAKQKRELGGRPIKETRSLSPIEEAVRDWHSRIDCPAHPNCNPLKNCPERDNPDGTPKHKR